MRPHYVPLSYLKKNAIVLYVLVNILSQASLFICQCIVLRFVAPRQMGIWQTLLLLESYLGFLRLGVINAMNVEFPSLAGKNRFVEAHTVVQTTLSFTIFNAACLFGVFAACLMFMPATAEYRIGLLSMAVASAGQIYVNFLESTYRVRDHFVTLSFQKLLLMPVQLLSLGLPIRYGFPGFCIRHSFLAVITLLVGHYNRPLKLSPRLTWPCLRKLLNVGWRLFAWSYFVSIAQTLPRTALILAGGTFLLGLFTPVNWAVLMISGIYGSVSAFQYPMIISQYSRSGESVGPLSLKIAMRTMLVLAPLVVVTVPLMPWAIARFFPEYQPASQAMQIALVAALVEALSVATISLGAMKAWKQMFSYAALAFLVRSVTAFAAVFFFKDKLQGAAWGMLAASIVMAMVTIRCVHSLCPSSRR